MAADLIRYDIIVQDAMRGVIRKVLEEVAKGGLPGEHHFYITFATRHPGVRLSQRLRAQYAEEMTIILQYQFWDLVVSDTDFEVGLSFGGIPERLTVPFRSITLFRDPAVEFALGFNVASETTEAATPLLLDAGGRSDADDKASGAAPGAKGSEVVAALPKRVAKKEARDETREKPAKPSEAKGTASRPKRPAEKELAAKRPEAEKGVASGEDGKGAAVVSLDAFRKKP